MKRVLACTALSLAFGTAAYADGSGQLQLIQIATLIAPPQPAAVPAPPPPEAEPAPEPEPEPAIEPAPAPAREVASPQLYIVFFGPKGTDLSAASETAIAHAAEAFKATGAASINVVGHTDDSGSPERNQVLSERRAERVKKSLVADGVPADVIVTTGKGSTEPMVPAEPGAPEKQNRRATIEIVMPPAK